mmetsp:Transcript_47032/g.134613  ORF Transcript_47032/g.134613 Transcript_47032/m.134613 type:complete len:101 (+) Transcript_47032:169-471(+)
MQNKKKEWNVVGCVEPGTRLPPNDSCGEGSHLVAPANGDWTLITLDHADQDAYGKTSIEENRTCFSTSVVIFPLKRLKPSLVALAASCSVTPVMTPFWSS